MGTQKRWLQAASNAPDRLWPCPFQAFLLCSKGHVISSHYPPNIGASRVFILPFCHLYLFLLPPKCPFHQCMHLSIISHLINIWRSEYATQQECTANKTAKSLFSWIIKSIWRNISINITPVQSPEFNFHIHTSTRLRSQIWDGAEQKESA